MAALEGFGEATRAWFEAAFAQPTPAQAGTWAGIASGRHVLTVAPTGSGKTLAAFLTAIDQLMGTPRTEPRVEKSVRVLYISPLKALGVDVERNLRAPLTGIRHTGERLGLSLPEISVGVRSGDTEAVERRRLLTKPPDILITTPESLFLMLTSQARQSLTGVHTVIVDEVHAVAGSKRGAHLALSLERLDALLAQPAQRIGLSATVRPIEEVARFLGGAQPVDIVAPLADKQWDLRVVVPVEDMTNPGTEDDEDPRDRASLWPHVEEQVASLIGAHKSTIVFTNARRSAERLTARLNEIAAGEDSDVDQDNGGGESVASGGASPAQVMAKSGIGTGAGLVLAKAHHGSVSKEQRNLIEDDLKAGRLPAVVATSSLELGIDMGAVDLVVQVQPPPSIAAALQRVGRAGHQVGAVSRGVIFPLHRGDLAQSAVAVERMRTGQIEALRLPANPLDVLAQQIVAMTALDDWNVEELFALVRRAAPFANLPRSAFEATLDLLSGRYPSDEFAQLRPRVVWDRVAGKLSGRPGAQRLAVTSGGTIPDRGLFGVFIASGTGPGRRVGELDEEMVYESRVGDVFALGASSWRIEDITHDRVLVTPAPGVPGRLPFWTGDTPGRPAELGRAIGSLLAELAAGKRAAAHRRLCEAGLDQQAAGNLLAYLDEQRAATTVVPSDTTIVVERFRDELGDWRLVVHSPFGVPVHAPWALAINARLQARYGLDGQAIASDDGIVIRIPDSDAEPPGGDLILFEADEIDAIVTAEVGGSALFASRFRECAARALLLPRRDPGRRSPLWQQRQRSAQLLEVAAKYPSFPIVLEAVRECLQDVYDLPGLQNLLHLVASRAVSVVDVETPSPSPFARSLLFGYVAQFMYEGDSPIAERRAAALTLDQGLLAELLGRAELRELLDPEVLAEFESQVQRIDPQRQVRSQEGIADLLRDLGPLTGDEVRQRCTEPESAQAWLDDLVASRRVAVVRTQRGENYCAVEDLVRLRDGLGIPTPPGTPSELLEPVEDPLGDLVSRFARTHGPFTEAEVADRLGIGVAVVRLTLSRLGDQGRVLEGEFRPAGHGAEWCDATVLRTLRRRSLAKLRNEIEPVSPATLGRFLPHWQQVGLERNAPLGVDGVLGVVEQLAGCVIPASALETLILPARVADYAPAMLDELTAAGEVLWVGHAGLPGDDGWISLHCSDQAALTLPGPRSATSEIETAILDALAPGGAWFAAQLMQQVASALGDAPDAEQFANGLWSLVWSGRITGDTLIGLRGMLAGGRAAHKARPVSRRRTRGVGRSMRPARVVSTRATASSDPRTAGRWSLLPAVEPNETLRAHATAEVLLERYGVLTRGSVVSEQVPGGFASVYKVLAAFDEQGRCRRGYFIDGLGAAQFGVPGAVDRLRSHGEADSPSRSEALALAATDPANPYGAALPWPERAAGEAGHRPGRKAGALVVLVEGHLVLYVERGGRSLLTWSDDEATLKAAASALATAARRGALGKMNVERADGEAVLGAGLTPLRIALESAGFVSTPRGLRFRP